MRNVAFLVFTAVALSPTAAMPGTSPIVTAPIVVSGPPAVTIQTEQISVSGPT